jgi:heme-degrading monooxygenase HmoA
MPAITLINSFEVPAGREDQFLQFWKQVNAYMQKKPGYLGHKLHRAITPDAPFRFVNVARWASMAHFQEAHDAGFRELADRPEGSGFQPHPILFEVVHEAHAETGSTGA